MSSSSENMEIDQEDRRMPNSMIQDEELREQFNRYYVQFSLKQKISLFVEMYEKNQHYIEYFPDFDLRKTTTATGDISLSELVAQLKRLGFNLEGRLVSYYMNQADLWVNCGTDPVHPDLQISKDEIDCKQLRMKFQHTGQMLIHMVMSEEMNEAVNKMKEGGEPEQEPARDGKEKGCRRTKERRIGFIIDKVKLWRDYYNGYTDQDGKHSRLTLDDAAKKVNISKKSLDDYLLQIRYGKKYGFNFNEHKNEKVGMLRAFVKKHQSTKASKKRIKKERVQTVQ